MESGHILASTYMEHGMCLNWEPPLVALHVGSDIITGISYYSIPIAMFYFAYRRRDLPFYKIFLMFAAFILSCGTTHLFSAYTIYRPDYWIEGWVKAVTAAISAVTAIVFIPRIPEAIALPSIISSMEEVKVLNAEMSATNAKLQMATFSVDNVFDPVYWIAADGRILHVNKAACSFLGYTMEEMLALTVFDINPRMSLDSWPGFWGDLKAKGSATREAQHRTRDGRLVDVEVSANYITYEGEEYYCAIARDITARKRSEKEHLANERRMAGLYNITQYPFTGEQDFFDHALQEVIDLTGSKFGYIYRYNEQSRQFTLNAWSGEVTRECSMLNPQTVYDLADTGIWGEAVRTRTPILVNDFQADHPLKKGYPEGHIQIRRFLTVPIIADDAIVAVVGVADKEEEYTETDTLQLKLFLDSVWMITMRKRADADFIQLEKQLLHAQKLESLGVLAGGIAHDFNNILMAIIGNADLALRKLPPESPVFTNLHEINNAAGRAADLAKQMLAYSGKGRFVVEAIDLNRLIDEMLHMLRVSISKMSVLRFNPVASIPAIEADATQIRQIIMNLVINASEAIGERSGVIAINTGWMECDRDYLRNNWVDDTIAEGTYVYLEIADTGCGMDDQTISKIFDPFFTTKFTGRGLGMAAVQGIVRGHKGSIRVYSEVGRGTTFKLLFPASEKPLQQSPRDAVGDQWRGSGTALLVDDEETVRATGAKLLRELGFKVLTACDGREAMETFKANPDISFVLLDLTMPHMDGEKCFRELKALNPKVKVVLSSGYNEQDVTQRFVGKGLAGFIQKPYKLSELQKVIMEI